MSRRTVNRIIKLVRRSMGNPTEELWSDLDILDLINQAQITVAMQKRPPYLNQTLTINTVVDEPYYDLPLNYLVMISIVNRTVGNDLNPIDARTYASINQGIQPPGPAIEWFEDQSDNGFRRLFIRLLPQRVEELSCRYLRMPVDMVLENNGGDEFLDLPREYDSLVLRSAIAEGLSYDTQLREAQDQKMYGRIEESVVDNVIERSPMQRYPIETDAARALRRGRD